MSESVKLEPFEREDRYIVIKRKPLSPRQEGSLRRELTCADIPTVKCVVVESDWPEYETVWRMIEDRVTGRHQPQEREVAEAVAAERERCAGIAAAEMDKCNLYVERKLGGEAGVEMNTARYQTARTIAAAIRTGEAEQ